MRKKATICPLCGEQVFEELNSRLDMNGDRHICNAPLELKPIGQAVIGKNINTFQVRDRRVTMQLGGNMVLEISAKGNPLNIRLISPSGVIDE